MSRKLALLAAVLALAGAGADARGQAPAAAPVYPAAHPKGHYAPLDALPDWGGVWTLKFTPANLKPPPPQPKGGYLADYQKAKAEADAHGGEFPHQGSYCTPPGALGGILRDDPPRTGPVRPARRRVRA